MACVHLQKLYQLCQENQLLLSSSDLVRVVCSQCGEQEVCPSVLTTFSDATETDSAESPGMDAKSTQSAKSS